MPERTTVVFPPVLKRRAVSRARAQGISFCEFVRRAVEKELVPSGKKHARKKTGDPFLDHIRTFDDGGPADLIDHLDDFLYGAHR